MESYLISITANTAADTEVNTAANAAMNTEASAAVITAASFRKFFEFVVDVLFYAFPGFLPT